MSWKTANLSKRNRTVTVSVDAEVYVSLSDVSTGDLFEELAEREDAPAVATDNGFVVKRDDLDDLLGLIQRRDWVEAEAYLQGILSPKWPTQEACEKAYKQLVGAA